MVDLFAHNQAAYDAALALLQGEGKAAIIHPTGTGKSFIAFKLCQEHPSAHICWLSPSEYIYRMQLENIHRASGFQPENILFLTYAKLMLLSSDERSELKPDYIILDEFHRCGAAEWGKGVEALLKDYPEAKLLGLTATHIRYLDEQRDMADELFDGCIAHQMTLGEAIVQGILPSPKYVMASYALDQEISRYARRARKAGGAAQLKAEKLLDRLRRKLEEADGIDLIFQKHMQDRNGKFILFCSDREHMQKVEALIPEWFGRIDTQPHVYRVFAESSESKRAFQLFREDQSDHLKLLLCIDMLNEGVHVDELSGVILCRPTVSPIIYKQQIGRALSALKDGTPVIFDLVNNVENLYSISAIRREMDEAIRFYANQPRGMQTFVSGFELIDEVRECRELFEQLEETLAASWDMMYAEAAAYYRENGHLNVPRRYRTETLLALGNWIQTQRAVRRGTRVGELTDEQIARLDQIGMLWQMAAETSWENGYAHAKAYRETQGHLDVPARYVCEDGYKLGSWLKNLRTARSSKRGMVLTERRIAQLDALGMIWNRVDFGLERSLYSAARYVSEHGHLRVPVSYVDEDGFKLGRWLAEARNRQDDMPEEKKRRLTDLGMEWQKTPDVQWEQAYEAAVTYYKAHGNLNVPAAHFEGAVPLGRWIYHQREVHSSGKMPRKRIEKLEAIGMDWQPLTQWERSFAQAKAYFEEHGHLQPPAQFVTQGGLWLDRWLCSQRKAYAEEKLSAIQISHLESIGIRWETKMDIQWAQRFEELENHCSRSGDPLSEDGLRLKRWYTRQSKRAANGTLASWQVEKLKTIDAAQMKTVRKSAGVKR